jgi:hypothetical protein
MARVDGLVSAAVPVEIVALDGDGTPIDSVGTFVLTNLCFGVTRNSDGYSYDFSDDTFKSSPTTALAALEAYDIDTHPGLFHYASGWTPPGEDVYTFTISQVGSPAVVANVPLVRTLFVGEYIGAASLGDNLVDDLVPVADELRDELHIEFGVRQYRCFGIRETWSGATVGVGAHAVTQVNEFLPSPNVELNDKHDLTPGGLLASGTCKLTEVSLTYTQNQIMGEPMAANEAWHIVLADGIGQEISRKIFIPQDHPTTDRDGNVGWEVILRMDEPANFVGGTVA